MAGKVHMFCTITLEESDGFILLPLWEAGWVPLSLEKDSKSPDKRILNKQF
jgi:hypothetical protein